MREFEEKRKRTRRRHEKEFAHFDHRGRPKKNLKFMSERFTSIASTTIVVCGGHFFRTGEVVRTCRRTNVNRRSIRVDEERELSAE
jgi:hypothetical protein